MDDATAKDIDEFRFHFDSMYIGGIPRLLDETGAFLSFLAMLTAVDALAGVWKPAGGTGERFKGFVTNYFPVGLRERADELWRMRNLMVHAFNPGTFALVCGQSRLHLTKQGEATVLNAQDLYGALMQASRAYFTDLLADSELQENFRRRVADKDGGAMQQYVATRSQ